MSIRVKAKGVGFYGDRLVSVGDIFEIKDEQAFSTRWMERLGDEQEADAKEPAQKPKGKRGKEAAKSSGDVEVI